MEIMEIKAWCKGFLLDKHKFFNVKHIFKHTIYLESEDQSLIVVSSYKWRAPFIVNVSVMEQEDFRFIVKPYDEALYKRGKLIFTNSGLIIDLSEADTYYRPRVKYCISCLSKNLINKLTGILVILSTVIEELLDSIEFKIMCETLSRNHPLSNKALEKLIGLGGGFTPACDDFYIGYLSLNSYLDSKDYSSRVFKVIRKYLYKTTWASRSYIIYSLLSLYDESIENLIHSLNLGFVEESINSLIELCRRGHSSGFYMSLGVLSGFTEYLTGDYKLIMCRLCRELGV